jgi:hypothetical protein
MCKKLIYLIPLVLALIVASSVQAEPFSLGAANDAHIGKDADLGLNGNANVSELQIHNVEGSRRVTLISYNISELQGGRKFIANVSFSNYGQDVGVVNVYGVIEDLDDNIDETTITWNTAPGVFKSSRNPAIGAPVELVMTDLTDVLLTFTAPEPGVRASTGTSQALDDFLNSDTDGIVAFLFAPAEEGTQATIQSKEHESGGTLLEGQVITPTGFNIIWVSYHGADDAPSSAAAAAGFTEAPDKGYTDLLTNNGYSVMRYITTGTPDVSVLNAADLVIIGRSAASGHYQNDAATTWNATVTAPMIITCGYKLRSSRMGFTTGTNMPDTTGDITLTVSDQTHPIFAGIPLTDGTMDNPFAGVVVYPTDGTTVARGISINTDPVNADGTVLATISEAGNGPVGGMVIAEWPAGATLTHAGGAGTDTLAGHRLVFLTGSRETDGINSETAGIYDLYADGAQMFLNAITYMLGISELEPVDPGTEGLVAHYAFENDANDSSGNELHGTLVGDAKFAEGPAGYGMALDLDGNGDYVDCGAPPQFDITEQIAITYWIKVVAFDKGWNTVLSRGDSSWRSSRAGENNFMEAAVSGTTGDWTYGVTPVDDEKWHHIGWIYDGTMNYMYVDGKLDASEESTGLINVTTYPLFIGNNSQNTDREWTGLIDEVMIYNRALSEAEVMYLAGKRATPVDPGSDGLVAYYAMENNTDDSSGNELHGTIFGDPTFVEGPAGYGTAMAFDGVDDYVDFGNDPLFDITEQVTLALWVNTQDIGTGQDNPWLGKGDTSYMIKGFRTGNQIEFFIYDGGWNSSFADVGDSFNGEWHHAAGTFDGEQFLIYVDGELETTLGYEGVGIVPNTYNVAIGTNTQASGRFSESIMDEAVIYNRALSAGEVRYLAGFRPMVDPGAEGLAAAYYFETDATDSSGNGYDGTLLGDAHIQDGMLVLDGADDAVAIPGIGDGLTEFTFSMMVYPTVDVVPLQFSGGINTDSWGGGVHLKLNYGTVNVGVEGLAGGDVVGTSIVQPNTWTHLALTVSPDEVAVYLNGEKEGSRTGEAVPAVNVGAASIGAWNNGGTDVQREMTGMMDNVLIYNRALSEAEVRYLANN